MSTALPVFKLPLPFPGPPAGFEYEGADTDSSSASTRDDFEARVESRDTFHGSERCIVCGHSAILEHCFIIPGEEDYTWDEMKDRRYIPAHSKREPKYESRNGMLMCPSHRRAFETLYFFIRYDDTTQKYYFINYGGKKDLDEFHGLAVALDPTDSRAPYPAAFLIHEMRVRGRWPFPESKEAHIDDRYQDWMYAHGLVNPTTGRLDKILPAESMPAAIVSQNASLTLYPTAPAAQNPPTVLQAPSRERNLLAPAHAVAANIVAASEAMPAWKAAEEEEKEHWTGTAAENIDKYLLRNSSSGDGSPPL